MLPSSAGFGEPSVAVDADGRIYFAAPGAHTALWRSDNGGASYQRVHDSLGSSGDSDVAIDANGVLYANDLFDNVPVSVSTDLGATMEYVTMSGTSGSNDRQWLAAHGDGNVWSIWRDGSTERVATSHDGAKTWTRTVAATGVGFQGNIVATSDVDLYIPIEKSGNAAVAISHDAGSTWVTRNAGRVQNGSFLFPAVALDAAGTIYMAWSEGGTSTDFNLRHAPRIVVTSSADDGLTWTPKATISTPGNSNIFPWLVAGAAGKVAVAWFEGVPPAGIYSEPDTAALTSWYVQLAYSADGGASWSTARATPVFHTGPICTFGTGCIPVANPVALSRQLLDFFEMAMLPDGRLVIAYSGDQSPGHPASRNTFLYSVVQTGGPNLL